MNNQNGNSQAVGDGVELRGRLLWFFKQFRQTKFGDCPEAKAEYAPEARTARRSWFDTESEELLAALAARPDTGPGLTEARAAAAHALVILRELKDEARAAERPWSEGSLANRILNEIASVFGQSVPPLDAEGEVTCPKCQGKSRRYLGLNHIEFCDECGNTGTMPAPLSDEAWRTMDSAPKNGTLFLTWAAPGQHDLPAMFSLCAWHEDAGFCIDELREPTHWRPLPAPPTPADAWTPADIGFVRADAGSSIPSCWVRGAPATPAERQRVESYLARKHGITLDPVDDAKEGR